MSLTVEEVGETTARISFSTSFSLPASAFNISYSGSIGKVNISKTSGSVKVSGLDKGAMTTISGFITCYYSDTTTTTNSDGTTTTITYSTSTDKTLGSCSVYTHPGAWSWSKYISTGDTISTTLKAEYINNWVDHLAAWRSWYEQANWYSAYNTYFDVEKYLSNNTNNGGWRVSSKDIICLGWFNNCIDAHPNNPSRLVKNSTDIISVENFQKLDFKGSGEVS